MDTIADLIDRVVTNIDNESIITEVGNEVEKMMQDRPLFTWE
jgi:glycine hydroxymethyltransferase